MLADNMEINTLKPAEYIKHSVMLPPAPQVQYSAKSCLFTWLRDIVVGIIAGFGL